MVAVGHLFTVSNRHSTFAFTPDDNRTLGNVQMTNDDNLQFCFITENDPTNRMEMSRQTRNSNGRKCPSDVSFEMMINGICLQSSQSVIKKIQSSSIYSLLQVGHNLAQF